MESIRTTEEKLHCEGLQFPMGRGGRKNGRAQVIGVCIRTFQMLKSIADMITRSVHECPEEGGQVKSAKNRTRPVRWSISPGLQERNGTYEALPCIDDILPSHNMPRRPVPERIQEGKVQMQRVHVGRDTFNMFPGER